MIQPLVDWYRGHPEVVNWGIGLSFVMFVGTLLIVPVLVARIPDDYFIRDADTPGTFPQRHWVVSLAGHIVKNLLGVIIVLMGVVMLFVPGQGVLTILIGVILLDFPGKRRLELALIRRPAILKAVNWMRQKAGRKALKV